MVCYNYKKQAGGNKYLKLHEGKVCIVTFIKVRGHTVAAAFMKARF